METTKNQQLQPGGENHIIRSLVESISQQIPTLPVDIPLRQTPLYFFLVSCTRGESCKRNINIYTTMPSLSAAQLLKRPGLQKNARDALRRMSQTQTPSNQYQYQQAHKNQSRAAFSSLHAPFTASPLNHRNNGNEDRQERYHRHQIDLIPINRRSLHTTATIAKSAHPHAATPMMHTHARFSAIVSKRDYSVTAKSESASIALGLGAVAATAKAAQYAVQAYREWETNQPEEPIGHDNEEGGASSENTSNASSAGAGEGTGTGTADAGSSEGRKNIFSDFFSVGSKYYEGGFEDKMTKREAALILGVRESSTEKRIKEAHRKLLILNHPDTGGSTYLSGKINEAKDLLLKAKGR